MKKCDYQSTLENAIIRYSRALDERVWQTAYLKLWSVLELLTNSQHESYKVLINRTSFIFLDRQFHRQVLNQLREYRNKYVHTDAENADIEIYMYQLKRYVEKMLGFHLGNTTRFESMEEVTKFLNLPYEKNTIESRIKLLKIAQRFFSYK